VSVWRAHACASEDTFAADTLLVYRDYLGSVARFSNEFSQTGDLLSRHATLQVTHEAQDATRQKKQSQMRELRDRLEGVRRFSETRQMDLSSEIEQSRRMLETMFDTRKELEVEREATDDASRRRVVEGGQVVMSVRNLYGRCRDSVELSNGADMGASAVASAGATGGKRGGKGLAAHLSVPPPSSDSTDEMQRYMLESMEIVQRRLKDLTDIKLGFDKWKDRQAKLEEQAVQKAAAQKLEAAANKRAKEASAAGAHRRIKAQRSQESFVSGVSGSVAGSTAQLDGGDSIFTGQTTDAEEAEADGVVDGGAKARHLAGNTYVVRLGGGAAHASPAMTESSGAGFRSRGAASMMNSARSLH
jgi:hypothetical protein